MAGHLTYILPPGLSILDTNWQTSLYMDLACSYWTISSRSFGGLMHPIAGPNTDL